MGDRRLPRDVSDSLLGRTSFVVETKDVKGVVDRSGLTDEELIRLVLAGDDELFEELILLHRDHVSRIVGGHVPQELVREASHEVFVKAYTALAAYAFEKPFAHWLATIAIHHCYDKWRQESVRKEISISGPGKDPHQWVDRLLAAESGERFATTVRQHDATAVLHWALAQLLAENRMVVTLVHLDGYSVREAAELLGWSVVNVKIRAHRARHQLRKILEVLLREST